MAAHRDEGRESIKSGVGEQQQLSHRNGEEEGRLISIGQKAVVEEEHTDPDVGGLAGGTRQKTENFLKKIELEDGRKRMPEMVERISSRIHRVECPSSWRRGRAVGSRYDGEEVQSDRQGRREWAV